MSNAVVFRGSHKGTHLMKRSSYREQDYTFGQLMLTLRTTIGLTQASLARLLHISRRAVGEWEAGSAYPKAEHLKAFIAMCIQQQAFPTGHEVDEAHALWKAAHQKVLLNEAWLLGLLVKLPSSAVIIPHERVRITEAVSTSPTGQESLVDWGNAPDVSSFYGREREVTTLVDWIVQERCRVVSVLGLGGIGKSALATKVMHQVATHFEVVLWHSLRDAPSFETLLDDWLQILAPSALCDASVSLGRRLGLLLDHMRGTRVLLVLDNLETLLEEGIDVGSMRASFEGFSRLLCQMAETEHQSCLVLTSRERPIDLVPLEGSRAAVRTLRLARLDDDSCQQLLAQKEVEGNNADQARLIEAYAGNPLALNIIAQTIVDLFGGEIAPFLEQGEVVFGGVRQLLDEQYARLAKEEQMVLHWLAIAREPLNLGELRASLVKPRSSGELLEALERLRQRSLIERGQRPGSFTLQSLVLEYMTARLGGKPIEQAGSTRASDPSWTFTDLPQAVYLADPGAMAAGSRAGVFA
jgi:DNA-binding XRE family transcriptional regulator